MLIKLHLLVDDTPNCGIFLLLGLALYPCVQVLEEFRVNSQKKGEII